MSPRDDDLISRLTRLVGSLFDDGDEPEWGAPEDRTKGSKAAKGPGDPLEHVVEFLKEQSAAAGMFRDHSRPGRHQLVAPGEQVELGVELDAILAVAARTARFHVGSETLGPVPVLEDRAARVTFRPKEAGVLTWWYEVLDDKGKVLDGGPEHQRIVHVVGGSPVAAVLGDVVLEAPAPTLDGIRALATRGWELVYLDATVRDRTRDILEAVRAKGLPEGAVLVHSSKDLEFSTLSVDFRHVLALLTVRRARAAGVPLVLVVGVPKWIQRAMDQGEILAVDPAALQDERSPGGVVARAEELARELVAARARTDAYTWRLDRMTRTRIVPGNLCRVEFDNRRARAAVFRAIERARETIHLQFYIFKGCRFTRELARRLITKARAGVRVRLMVDAIYSAPELLGPARALLGGLEREPNLSVLPVDPITAASEIEALRLKQRDHRKLIIVDGEVAFVGGRNAGDEYYSGFDEVPVFDWTDAEEIPWLDAHVEVRGPLVAKVQAGFVRTWLRNRGPAIPSGDLGLARHDPDEAWAPGSSSARFVVHEGIEDANALAAYEAIIDSARERVYVVNDFPVVASLAAALRRAAARGVVVRFLTGNGNARRSDGTLFKGPLPRELFEYVTKQRFGELMLRGVEVYEYSTPVLPNILTRGGTIRPYVHAKVLTADGRIASIGSANLDATAGYWERETIVVVQDPEFVASVDSALTTMFERSLRIDPESDYWRAEATKRSIVGSLWPSWML